MKRRLFLQSALASSITLPAFALEAGNPYRKNIGIQLYTLRNQIKKDVGATIKAVAEAGYVQVEPYGFPDAGDMISAAKDNGLKVNSSHFAWESVTQPDKEGVPAFSEILEKAKEAGLSHLVIPYIHGHNRENLDGYRQLAERTNKAAVEARSAGIQLCYHNHAFEFQPMEGGKCGYDILIEEFAPEMQFEIDTFWVKVGGVDPAELIRKLKGRVSQLHLKDLKKGTSIPEYGKLPNDAFQELGDGMIPVEPLLVAAADAGVAHCHVEQDQSSDPIASIRQSMTHLQSL
ncbi:MAG: sugar phosphate isomerase/epimerase [Verrucomicrobiales bacterium]|nr:sugar phosphate isomerase/epimerase [Verrucomicrobiales bacterium]